MNSHIEWSIDDLDMRRRTTELQRRWGAGSRFSFCEENCSARLPPAFVEIAAPLCGGSLACLKDFLEGPLFVWSWFV